MIDVHSLHLQQAWLPLVKFGQPLSFLRHLSLENREESIESHLPGPDYKDTFNFLSPHYLPSLDSLNITRIFLNSPTFLDPFLKIAPQLRCLFLAPLDQRHVNDFLRDQRVDIILPTPLLSACSSLKHLALCHASYSALDSIPFNSYAAYLPSSLRTLILEPKEFRKLREAFSSTLPPNLASLQDIVICPAEDFFESSSDVSVQWAKQVGVNWRLASEYSYWVDDDMIYDRVPYEMTQDEVKAMEVWNDLKERLD